MTFQCWINRGVFIIVKNSDSTVLDTPGSHNSAVFGVGNTRESPQNLNNLIKGKKLKTPLGAFNWDQKKLISAKK